MIAPKRWWRFGTIAAIALIMAIGTAVWAANYTPRGTHRPDACNSSSAGYADGTSCNAYCESAANTSPDKGVQLEWVQTHEVVALGKHNNPADIWLDYPLGGRWDTRSITIRYFTGSNYSQMVGSVDIPKEYGIQEAYPRDSQLCTFGLVLIANHPEIGAATARYIIPPGGSSENCRSTVPPVISRNADGEPMATIRCDIF